MLEPVVLVPRRSDAGHRDRLWSYCRTHWERHGFTVVEGHHDDGPFNRSAAVNAAADAAGDWSVALIVDSDIIIEPECVRQAFITDAGSIVYPFDDFHALTKSATLGVLGGGDITAATIAQTLHGRHGWALSCLVIHRPLWDDLGGMDARFEGWGFEDAAFHHAATTVGGDERRFDGRAWHLWHEPAATKDERSPTYTANAALCARYLGATTADAIHRVRGDHAIPTA